MNLVFLFIYFIINYCILLPAPARFLLGPAGFWVFVKGFDQCLLESIWGMS